MRRQLSRLLRHRAARIGYRIVLGLFAVLLAVHAIAIYAVNISCVFYNGPLYGALLFAYYVVTLAASALSLLGLVGWAILGEGRRALLFLAITLAVFVGGFRVFADAAFHCFGEAMVEVIRALLAPAIQMLQPP